MKVTSEVRIDAALVRALLAQQYSDLAGLTLVEVGGGWDNKRRPAGSMEALFMQDAATAFAAMALLEDARQSSRSTRASGAAAAGRRAPSS